MSHAQAEPAPIYNPNIYEPKEPSLIATPIGAPGSILGANGQPGSAFTDLQRAITQQWGDSSDYAPERKKSLAYMYFRMCDRQPCARHSDASGHNERLGWIAIGPSESSDPFGFNRHKYNKHWTPLPQYGEQYVGPTSEMANGITRFSAMMLAGGIYDFPASQIVAYAWDKMAIIRQYRPDVIPFFEGRLTCEYGCVGRDFVDLPALRKHFETNHKDVVAQEASGRQMKEAMELLAGKLLAGAPSQALDPTVMATAMAMAIELVEARRSGAPAPLAHQALAADLGIDLSEVAEEPLPSNPRAAAAQRLKGDK